MKLSDYVIDFLKKEGARHVFEVCGGSITHLLDSLYGRKDITAISMHHEQAAAFAAEAYSRIGGHIGVAMATSGPGATNLITGIGSAFFDSTPCLFLTGQVNTYEFKFNKPVRQVGFQETDIVNIVKPIVKEAHLVADPNKIKYYLERAVYIAKSGRPGPVLLDIPMDIQRAEIIPKKLESFKPHQAVFSRISKETINRIARLISASSRPIILVGGGVRISGAQSELLELIEKTHIPLVSSLMGLDIFPHDLPEFTGMIGTYGNRYANLAIANSDMVLSLGSRLDTRQTGTRPNTFARGAKIIQVDIDPRELNNKIKTDIAVCSDIKEFLMILNKNIDRYDKAKIRPWSKTIKHYKTKYPAYKMSTTADILPNFFMDRISDVLPDDTIICVDVGQHQMWAGQSLKTKQKQRFITEGGMASMGSSLAMAIGASFANPKKIITVITGDGGFQANIQELQTVFHHNLPIKIILLNNNGYGMIRQFQRQYFESRFQSTVLGYSQPDFQKVVAAHQIHAMRIEKKSQIEKAAKILFSDKKPMFLEVVIKEDNLVIPKLSVNKPIEDQEPYLSRNELKSNMFIELLPETETNAKRKN